MKVKLFDIKDTEAVNEFIDSHVLLEDGAVQVTSDGIVVFYKASKEEYPQTFLSEMIENLKRNKYHEEVRLAAMSAELEVYKDKGGKSTDFDEVLKKQKDATHNIRLFDSKITSLEEWKENNTSKI